MIGGGFGIAAFDLLVPAARLAVLAEALAPSGQTLEIVPGPVGRGVVYVRFAKEVPTGGVVHRGTGPIRLGEGVRGSAYGMGPGTRIIVRPGVVVEPPPDEASRMGATMGQAGAADLEMLRALGYIGGGSP